MKCYLCNTSVTIVSQIKSGEHTKNIGIKIEPDKYICLPCEEVSMFFENDKTREKKPDCNQDCNQDCRVNSKTPIITEYKCINCKQQYSGSSCDKCDTINPLYCRQAKKKHNKRKK
mgnify:FL=1